MKDLSASIAKLMEISDKVRRMDSMMIESNIRKLSQMELIYTCISKLAVHVDKANATALADDLKHYLDPNDFNRVIYDQRNTDANDRTKQFLAVAEKLLLLGNKAISARFPFCMSNVPTVLIRTNVNRRSLSGLQRR